MRKKAPANRIIGPADNQAPSLASVRDAVRATKKMSPTRQRDLCSAVTRIAKLLGDDPARIKLDMPAISAGLAAINPVADGLSHKRLSNIRSDFLAAVTASGLGKGKRLPQSTLRPRWAELLARASRRARIGLSRLARFASGEGIDPEGIDDRVLEQFVEWVRQGSLNPRPVKYRRQVAIIWNELAESSSGALSSVVVPSSNREPQRIDLSLLPESFRLDQERYLEWCRGSDPFDPSARERSLADSTVQLRRNQIHSAVTALIESGVAPSAITGLASVAEPEAFKRIFRLRLAITGDEPNAFNHGLAGAIVQIACDWVKPDNATLSELKRLLSKVPAPRQGLTSKNKIFLRQFDDPDVGPRLYRLAQKLYLEAKRDPRRNFHPLAKAQAALAIEILCYMPIRAQNLTSLTFDRHIFLNDHVRGTSSLELAADEVKNDEPVAFDIPTSLASMLRDYREQLAPRIVGHRPKRLFVNVDGSPKCQDAISDLVIRYARRRGGVVLTPHQFRHLNAKLILDAAPGAFETVRQLLGHKALKTTTASYSGIDTRRAARHHHRLIEEMLAQRPQPTQRRMRGHQRQNKGTGQ